jgi:polyhydroxyalkanoate synthesis regulator phasin
LCGMPAETWKRYFEAASSVREMTRKRAEDFVQDLVRAGELRQERAQKAVDELLERSRKNTEEFVNAVRREFRSQVSTLGIATKDDIARLEAKINRLSREPAKRAGAKKTAKTTKSTPTKKAAAAKKA